MRAVIIEDEIRTARVLEKYLTTNHGMNVLTIIPSIEEGIAFFESKPEVDIIFSDIEIADGLSFDLFREINIKTPVIFCTAYNQYALDAFRSNGIDYLIKPFTEQTIADAVKKFETLVGKKQDVPSAADIYSLLKNSLQPAAKTSVLVTFREKTFPVELSSVAYFFVDNEITWLHTNGHDYVISKTLEELETITSRQQFYRANRQYLINRTFVKEVEQFFARKLAVKLSVPVKEQVIVSKAKASDFMSWLEQ